MVKNVSPGVVQIVTPSGTGSGFIINEDGLVVTNAHVVQSFDTVDVRLSGGQTYQGEVLGVDESTDLALLDLRGFIDFQPVELGDSDTFAVGEDVIAMGFPLGDVLQGSPTTTKGILSAKRTSKLGVKLLQIDAAINPGNSGGPLFDREGRVVGVNTSKLFESGDGRPVEGIGLAIAVNEVRDRLDSLARGGGVSQSSPATTTTVREPAPAPTGSLVSTSAGLVHTCGTKVDGFVECWGDDSEGQATPPGGSFVSVSAGGAHTCGVRTNRSVECWGSNEDTDGDFLGQATPTDESFISVSAGLLHTCGVKAGGSVECWGDDSEGQATPPGGSFVSVSAGAFHTCGVKTDNSTTCWGDHTFGQSTPPDGSIVSVSAGAVHTCGVRADGSVECWGDDSKGQATPPGGSFVSVSAGAFHTCGVKTDGSIVCWGANEDTEGNLQGQATPPGGSLASVSAGYFHTCGVRTDGSVVCWGWDIYGQSTPPAGSFSFVSAGFSSHLRNQDRGSCRMLG